MVGNRLGEVTASYGCEDSRDSEMVDGEATVLPVGTPIHVVLADDDAVALQHGDEWIVYRVAAGA